MRELTESKEQTLNTPADEEPAKPFGHICAQGKDVWALLTDAIDHAKPHAGHVLLLVE